MRVRFSDLRVRRHPTPLAKKRSGKAVNMEDGNNGVRQWRDGEALDLRLHSHRSVRGAKVYPDATYVLFSDIYP